MTGRSAPLPDPAGGAFLTHRMIVEDHGRSQHASKPSHDPPGDPSPRRDSQEGLRILVVDDEETLRTVVGQVIAELGHEVTTAASGEEALVLFRRAPFPLVLADIVMGGMSGLDLLDELKLIDPQTHVVIMTSNASLDSATAALRSGAYDYLTKPFEDIEVIAALVRRAVQSIRLTDENARLLSVLRARTEELERLNLSLQDMANRDGLTGLFNHRFFRDSLRAELVRSAREGRSFSICLADIDHFKDFNDAYGHLAGDEALKKVAGVLRSVARGDTVAARYGGEEFVMLLADMERDPARALAERARQLVAAQPFTSGSPAQRARLTISLGVSTYPQDGADANTLIASADRALYEAKNSGRDRVCAGGEIPPARAA